MNRLKIICIFAALFFVMGKKNINRELNKLIKIADDLSEIEVPLCGGISAGFPSEAYNYVEKGIDFNEYIIKHKESTYCLWAEGESMNGDGIFRGDMLVIDKLVEPYDYSILAIFINGEFTLKRLKYCKDHIELVSSNPEQPPIKVYEWEDIRCFGVLTYIVRDYLKNDRTRRL